MLGKQLFLGTKYLEAVTPSCKCCRCASWRWRSPSTASTGGSAVGEGSPAGAAVGVLLAGPPCAAVLEAIVAKYLAITPEELAEWQARPPCR